MAFKKIHSLVSFFGAINKTVQASLFRMWKRAKNVIFIHCAPTQRNMSLRMTGDVNVINCGDSSVGLGLRVCVFVLRRQRNLIAKLIDLFLLPFAQTQPQWHLSIFALTRPSFFFVFLSNDRVHFTRYFDFYSPNTGTEHNESNEPIEVDSIRFNLFDQRTCRHFAWHRCDFRYYHTAQVVIVHLLPNEIDIQL